MGGLLQKGDPPSCIKKLYQESGGNTVGAPCPCSDPTGPGQCGAPRSAGGRTNLGLCGQPEGQGRVAAAASREGGDGDVGEHTRKHTWFIVRPRGTPCLHWEPRPREGQQGAWRCHLSP